MNSLDLNFFLENESPELFFKKFKIIQQEYLNNFASPQFSSQETGISRRELSIWNKKKLLPFQFDEHGWKRYSLVDCVWLRFVEKLKGFNISDNTIIELKDMLFIKTAEGLKDFYNNFKTMPSIPESSKEFLDAVFLKLEVMTDKEIEEELNEFSLSIFNLVVMLSSMFHLKFGIFIHEDGDLTILNIGKPLNESHEINISDIMGRMKYRSFIFINIHELYASFFDNEKMKINNDFYFGIMNKNEKDLITEIRKDKYKEIKVIIKDGSITHLRPTKNNKENEEIIKKFSRLMKKGDYKRIELKVVNGDIVSLEEEDIIKMKS